MSKPTGRNSASSAATPATSFWRRSRVGTEAPGADHFDVLVFGGGPAGSAAARGLALAGGRVLLVERHDFQAPRPGEHLAGAVRDELDRLDIAYPKGSGLAQSSAGILSVWSGAPAVRSYWATGEAQGLCVIRNCFDDMLFQAAGAAGAATMVRTRLSRFCRADSRWQVSLLSDRGEARNVTAASIVEATGRRAAFARSQGAHRINHGDLFALVGWLRDDTPKAREESLLLVEACPSGWWSLSAGIGGRAIATHYTSLAALKASCLSPRDFWRAAIDLAPAIRRAVASKDAHPGDFAICPAFPSHASKMSGDGWIAVGDAAAALDPVGGQGVLFSLETAARAVEALKADPSLETLGPIYEKSVRARLNRHLDGRTRLYAGAHRMLPEIAERVTALPPARSIPA